MRKFYTYFIAFIIALLTFSCTNDLAELPAEDLPLADPKDCIIGISPQIEPGEEGLTRSSLTFSPTLRAMTFAWDATDALGVYPINATNISTAQQKFSINANDINGLSAIFSNADTDINSITSGQRYVAYSPFTAVDEDKKFIHVTYRNQIQKESVNMDAYYKRSQSDEQMQAYYAHFSLGIEGSVRFRLKDENGKWLCKLFKGKAADGTNEYDSEALTLDEKSIAPDDQENCRSFFVPKYYTIYKTYDAMANEKGFTLKYWVNKDDISDEYEIGKNYSFTKDKKDITLIPVFEQNPAGMNYCTNEPVITYEFGTARGNRAQRLNIPKGRDF